MSDENNTQAQPRGTQIRLALVMNGGVSLAVWMGGVTHELDLLQRASRPGDSEGEVTTRDSAVFKIWHDLAGSMDKEVRIDIVSGTSAGGLNGLFLATATARNATLPDLRDMWQSSASLDKLLKRPSKLKQKLAGATAEENAVLNGQYFEQEIGKALKSIGDGSDRDGGDVTLFITATALDGRCRNYRDGYGRIFSVADHRRVYRFESKPGEYAYRKQQDGCYAFGPCEKGEKNHFDREAEPQLTLAGRATASFPGAFQPVDESPLLDRRIIPDDVRRYPASSVMDGGVLNNEPFGSVLEAITKRVASRAVQRVVVYVVPSSGQVAEERAKGLRSGEISLGATLWSATNYPKEANFRASVEELEDRLATSGLAGRDELFERLILAEAANGDGVGWTKHAALDPEPPRLAEAQGLLGEYRRSRLAALLLALRPAVGTDTDAATVLAAPQTPSPQALTAILDEGKEWRWCPSNHPAEIANPGRGDTKFWRWGLIVAERVLQTFGNHLQARLQRTSDAKGRREHGDTRKVLMEKAEVIDRHLRRVIAITEAVIAEEARRRPVGIDLSEEQVVRLVEDVFHDMNVNCETGELVWDAANQFAQALRKAGPTPSAGGDGATLAAPPTKWSDKQVISLALRVEVLTQTFAPPAKVFGKLTPRFEFLRLGPDSVGPLFNEDWAEDLGDRKLYGTRFHHFGAFIDDEWRKSDFLWGRMDAVHHLLPLLMPECDVLAKEMELQRAILKAETGRSADAAIASVRDSLAQLKKNTNAQLLDDNRRATVKAAGDSSLRWATRDRGWLVRQIAFSVWAYVWEAWSHGRSPHGLIGASKRLCRTLLWRTLGGYLVLLAGIVAIIVLVIVL
ncbi:patatin-related protein [Actinacidiphila yanglinensis]|uniref:Patatin-related protein n=1 Tax=Actinacidiphila yanglinensis TaxID=310779 RepID=A0A1H5YVK0_9ACTN|nr:DUF3376 domain-containing protein [Actinacidiphila yanglinensis]SEG27782.1 patatin-related protein [Actinacidiphila yanglinensis]